MVCPSANVPLLGSALLTIFTDGFWSGGVVEMCIRDSHIDVAEGRAMAADFTNEGWISELGYTNTPRLTRQQAGHKLWELAQPHHFSFFEHWYTDVLGHEQALTKAINNFQCIDSVLAGLLEVADLGNTLIIVSSDHGNVEDCSHGKHSENPCLLYTSGGGTSICCIGGRLRNYHNRLGW